MTCVSEESSALQQRAALVYGMGSSLGHGDVFKGKVLRNCSDGYRGDGGEGDD